LAPQSLIVHRPTPSQGANSASAPGNEDAGSVLAMPDTPVSASDSVAVSSRLHIPVPAATGPQASQQKGNVQIGRLESRVEIIYPPEAQAQLIEGIVKLHVTIGTDGAVASAAPMSGAPLLASASLDAVRQWRYKPTLMDGRPIETEADITVVFRLPQTPQ
jgi:TonB family protein